MAKITQHCILMVDNSLYVQAYSVFTVVLADIGYEEIYKQSDIHAPIYAVDAFFPPQSSLPIVGPVYSLRIYCTHRNALNSDSATDAGPFSQTGFDTQMLCHSIIANILPVSENTGCFFFSLIKRMCGYAWFLGM